MHVHVHHETGEAKIWLEPVIAVAENRVGMLDSVRQSLINDNTRPYIRLKAGPTGEINVASATFSFAGNSIDSTSSG